MRLIINGREHDIAATTLEAALAILGYDDRWLATAVNCELVRAGDRAACRLCDGDQIEILSPRQGG